MEASVVLSKREVSCEGKGVGPWDLPAIAEAWRDCWRSIECRLHEHFDRALSWRE